MTFRNDQDPLFTIATDSKGRTYRVMSACGGGAQYYLSPHNTDCSATTHRGRYIKEADPLFGAIEAAEKIRRDAVLAEPLTDRQKAVLDRFAENAI